MRNNPVKYTDPTGHCPAPPTSMGAVICVALFIAPDRISAGPLTVHGDGRTFDSNSDPAQSRGYAWIRVDADETVTHMNPSAYIYPASVVGHEAFQWVEPSPKNSWHITRGEDGKINVQYDLVISGILEQSGTAPHINGEMSFYPDGQDSWAATFTRDGFPWAEAYYHDGKGNVQTIFQDPAVRGNPHDLFAIEPTPSWLAKGVKWVQSIFLGKPQISEMN